MKRQHRSKLIEEQLRSFQNGTVENINDQWVFFDAETEEASLLEEFAHTEAEVFRGGRWTKGKLNYNGELASGSALIQLQNGETVRLKKQLPYSLDKLLEEMGDEAFIYFLEMLNSLQFSLYDCIYCYNHLHFLYEEKETAGVNFAIFDNEKSICSIHHHFNCSGPRSDRFEFTLNNGKRTIIEKIS